jgi:hypothetical protein
MRFTYVFLTAVVACALAPSAAGAAATHKGTATIANLSPLAGHTERGLVQLFVRPKSSSVTAAIAPYSEGDTATHFTVVLSRRRCRGVASHPGKPGYIGETEKNLFDPKPVQGFYLDDFIIGAVPPRNVRAARSMVMLVTGKGGKLEPHACGNTTTGSLAKTRFKPRRPSVLVALLLPFADRTERADLQLTVRPGQGSDELALAGDFNGDSYSLRFSRRSCAGVQKHLASPGFFGPQLLEPTAYSGTVFDDESVPTASTRNAHAAKSIVLVGREGSGGKFEPRACGAAIELEDVLISS